MRYHSIITRTAGKSPALQHSGAEGKFWAIWLNCSQAQTPKGMLTFKTFATAQFCARVLVMLGLLFLLVPI